MIEDIKRVLNSRVDCKDYIVDKETAIEQIADAMMNALGRADYELRGNKEFK